VIAARTSSKVRVERITSVGADKSYKVDSDFPGTFTAADLFVNDESVATIIGLHLRYRKDKNDKFIGHPEDDLDALKKDFEAVFKNRKKPLIVAGDFNYEMEEDPPIFKKVFKKEFALVDAFEKQPQATFEQDWGGRHWFRMDYMFVSKILNGCITLKQGGNIDFPESLSMSDHSPLLVEIDLSLFSGN
jgi:endonuclease/exonuclease/phosphatase family metal-dependent hydrolase